MSDRVVSDFPLFPLAIVAIPHELVPLHIFEQRYRTMISECLERGTEFGIVWAGDEGLRPVGCAMEITDVLERMDDGRMNILTRGTRPFRIVDEQHDLDYPAGTVEFLVDKTEAADAKTQTAAHEAYGALVTHATDREPDAEDLEAMTAYQMAATVDFGSRPSRGCSTCAPRTPGCDWSPGLFRAAMKRLDFIERAQERARSNGKVRFS